MEAQPVLQLFHGEDGSFFGSDSERNNVRAAFGGLYFVRWCICVPAANDCFQLVIAPDSGHKSGYFGVQLTVFVHDLLPPRRFDALYLRFHCIDIDFSGSKCNRLTEIIPVYESWKEQMTIHDHFDGDRNCVECNGPCRLTGDDLAVTRIVRYSLVQVAYFGKHPGVLLRNALLQAGIDCDRFISRAEETTAPFARLGSDLLR